MFFAQHVKKVYSIELVQEASQDGEKNALSNGLQNMEFIADKVESFLKKFLDE
jgi:23S rRNA (uracil1939-C5)-methyltransferase